MKTLDEILKIQKSNCIDGRDTRRLFQFIDWKTLQKHPELMKNITKEYLNEERWMNDIYVHEFTRENVLQELREDLAFAFTKALDKRGLSSAMMFEVVKMWCWILEDSKELAEWSYYKYYGLPLFKAVAEYYGFPNAIGNDNGDEEYYDDI